LETNWASMWGVGKVGLAVSWLRGGAYVCL
jgi:hypothetical protein